MFKVIFSAIFFSVMQISIAQGAEDFANATEVKLPLKVKEAQKVVNYYGRDVGDFYSIPLIRKFDLHAVRTIEQLGNVLREATIDDREHYTYSPFTDGCNEYPENLVECFRVETLTGISFLPSSSISSPQLREFNQALHNIAKYIRKELNGNFKEYVFETYSIPNVSSYVSIFVDATKSEAVVVYWDEGA